MFNFILLASVTTLFARIFVGKTDLKSKNTISLVIGISLASILNLIQILIDFILTIIF